MQPYELYLELEKEALFGRKSFWERHDQAVRPPGLEAIGERIASWRDPEPFQAWQAKEPPRIAPAVRQAVRMGLNPEYRRFLRGRKGLGDPYQAGQARSEFVLDRLDELRGRMRSQPRAAEELASQMIDRGVPEKMRGGLDHFATHYPGRVGGLKGMAARSVLDGLRRNFVHAGPAALRDAIGLLPML